MPLEVSIVTPEREVWSGEASFVLARAAGGDIGILPSHAPFLASLGFARLIVHEAGDDGGAGTQRYVAVHGGFVEVLDNRVTVLTGTAEVADQIDTERAQRQREDAEAALRETDTPENRQALLRASNRIRTAIDAGLLQVG